MDNKPYPQEQIDWLKGYYPTHSMKDTHKAFNEHFGVDYTIAQIKHRCQKNGIRTAHDGKFKKGCDSWNKGMDTAKERPDIYAQFVSGSRYRFQKGCKPANTLPIGSETKYKDFVIVKVSDKEWKPRARVNYEKANNCVLTKKDKILHLDGNKYNDEPSNLIKVDDSIIARLVRKKLIFSDGALTKLAVSQELLLQAIYDIEKGGVNESKNEK